MSPSKESSLDINLHRSTKASQDVSSENASHEWVTAIEQNPIEQDHVRWLLARMVEEFAKDPIKGSTAITEIILLGSVLDREHYRKLLNCFINEFERTIIMDVDLLHGLVQLIQCASEGYLVADDLIKIMSILRTSLQNTHQQSSEHPYHLTLALSRILDVMAKHEVKDVGRVEEHEPLAAILSSLRDSSDPFLMYQASYAFQALQCVPDDETVLQAVMRHSGIIAESLVGISGVVNLDLAGFLEGLGQLQKTIAETVGIAKTAIESARSLIETGKGVFESIKEGVSSGHKRAWYPAIIGAATLVQEGRLADFKTVVMKAACRQSPEFQWGICQLLGEVAVDSTWESAIRREAVEFLAGLYTNDPDWGQDASVKMWMLTIFRIVSEDPEQSIHPPAAVVLQSSGEAEADKFSKAYPLRSRLTVPKRSSLLDRVQEIPSVEQDLNQLRVKRLRNHDQAVYILPQAKASLQASDQETWPLMGAIEAFLGGARQVFLILGDSGAGKSTFNRYLENELWKEYTAGGIIPLFIDLPVISEQYQDIIGMQLRIHKFSEEKIKDLKEHRQLILICDGYDETQLKVNLHTANMLNQELDTKMIISCRSTYLGQDYRNQFQPLQSDGNSGTATSLYMEAVIVPFSSDQIEDYVHHFVRDAEVRELMGRGRVWSANEYMSTLQSIPNMMELVKNPLMLSLSLRALPRLVQEEDDLTKVEVTRLTLYSSFTDQWLDINKRRLENITLSAEVARKRKELLEEGFASSVIDFLKNLAAAIFKEQDGNPIVQYTPTSDQGTWKFKFFGSEPEKVLLRESGPLSRAGSQHRFIHRSLLEYFYFRHIYELNTTGRLMSESCWDMAMHPLSQRNLVNDSSVIDLLAEYIQSDLGFKQQLLQIIELTKVDATASQAAANAITILVRAGVRFNGADLQGIQIPGADLSGGQFDSAQLQGADLRGTNLRSIWLRQADLSNAQLEDAQFGELPVFKEEYGATSCAYSADGDMFAIGLKNGTTSLYETATWEKTRTLCGHLAEVRSVAFSPNGQQIASGGYDMTVRIWDAQTGTPGAILSGHTHWVRSVSFSPNGKQIISGSDDNKVRLWDAHSGAPGPILSAHSDWVRSVVFSPSGQQIASGSDDNTVLIWDAQTGAPGAILSGHTSYVMSVAYSPSGQQIASGSYDNTVRIWDAETSAPGAILTGHTSHVVSVAFSPSGQQIASGSYDKTVRLWDAKTGTCGAILGGHASKVMSVVFSPNGQQITSGGEDKAMRIWDLQTFKAKAVRSGHSDWVTSVAFSSNGQKIASASDDKTVQVWDTETGAPTDIQMGHTSEVWSVVFSPSGQQIASAGEDNTVRLWDLRVNEPGPILRGHTSHVMSVVFSPNGQRVASGSHDNTIRIWDAQTGAPEAVLSGHTSQVMSVVFSPNGKRIASGSYDKTVRLWKAQTGAPGPILSGHTSSVTSVVFSPSGQRIASGSVDKTIRLWDVQTDKPGAVLSGHTASVRSVAFSPSGQQIASGSDDGTVRFWDVKSGLCLTVVDAFHGGTASVAWTAIENDSYLASGGYDASVRVWRVIGDQPRLFLCWSSGRNQLTASDSKISNVQGLSRTNMKLLEQRGASGSPMLQESATDDD